MTAGLSIAAVSRGCQVLSWAAIAAANAGRDLISRELDQPIVAIEV
jgi:hypothetical protein